MQQGRLISKGQGAAQSQKILKFIGAFGHHYLYCFHTLPDSGKLNLGRRFVNPVGLYAHDLDHNIVDTFK
jgi:hypothetical protein